MLNSKRMLKINFFLCLLVYLFLLNESNNCKKFVQLSAAYRRYIAYLPIVIKAWNRVGFCAIIIIVCYNISKQITFVINTIKHLKCHIYLLQLNKSISLHYYSKVARIYGFTKLYNNKLIKYFYLSDVDMVPISKKYFHDINYNKLTIKSFDEKGYGFGSNRGRWAMCYMVANQYIWYDILKDDIRDENLKQIVTRVTISELKKGINYFNSFAYIDEVYLRDKIKKWKYYKSNVIFNKRNYDNTRIERNFENYYLLLKNSSLIIDIHLPKLSINITQIWIKKISPLQTYLFGYVPYDIKYITSLYPVNYKKTN